MAKQLQAWSLAQKVCNIFNIDILSLKYVDYLVFAQLINYCPFYF